METRHRQSRIGFPSVKTGGKQRDAKGQQSKQSVRLATASEVQEEAQPVKRIVVLPKQTRQTTLSLTRSSKKAQEKDLAQQQAEERQESHAEKRSRSKSKTRETEPEAPQATQTRSSSRKVSARKQPQAQASNSPYKSAKRGSNPRTIKCGSSVQRFDRYEVHGNEYKVGDVVYVLHTEDPEEWPEEDAEDLCVACERGHKSHTILECDRCLAGYHMSCLRPALKTVPKGVWVCDACLRGEDPAGKRKLRTAYEMFLLGPQGDDQLLSLGLVTGFVKNRAGDGEAEMQVRYFCRPQDTHQGRQAHNGSREVFLMTTEYYESVLAIWGAATVCPTEEFDDQEGTDVYCCDYEYDEQWKRFRRRLYTQKRQGRRAGSDSDESDSDFDAAAEAAHSDDEECVKDRTFKPIYAFWAEKGLLPNGFRGRSAQPRRTGALNRQTAVLSAAAAGMQGADEAAGETAVLELKHGGISALPAPRDQHNALLTARNALALAAPPAVLPCRDQEKQQLTRFVKSAIQEEGGVGPGVLYVCGVPGTGKTACISEVMNNLRPEAQSKGVQLVFLNALSLPSPTHVYCKLWEKLTGQRLGPARALAALEAMFTAQGPSSSSHQDKRPCMTMLVVDEIDVLITKDQSVLYNLFEWPVRPGARLAVIGISNTHDLDDRVLPRISSRLASSKLAFNAYQATQLQEIVTSRLKSNNCEAVVQPVGVLYAARKVASTSGDVRRALELLRRAVELAEAERRKSGGPPLRIEDAAATGAVTAKHVQIAISEMFSSPHMQYLKACSRLEKLALVAVMLETRATSKAEASIQAVHARLTSHVGLLMPEALCGHTELCNTMFDMAAKRLLVAGPSWHGLKARIALNVHKDDVCLAVREDAQLAPVHGQLA